MAPKRAATPTDQFSTSNGGFSSATPSPSKRTKTWSVEEEERFLALIDLIVKKQLWSLAKDDELISMRGANGVRSHWDALYKKLAK